MGIVYHPYGVFWQPDALDFVAISLLKAPEQEFEGRSVRACYNPRPGGLVEVRWSRAVSGLWRCSSDGDRQLSRRQLDDQSTDRPYPPSGMEAKDLRPAFLTKNIININDVYDVEFCGYTTTIRRMNFIVDYWDAVHGLYEWMEGVVPGGFPIGLPMMGTR